MISGIAKVMEFQKISKARKSYEFACSQTMMLICHKKFGGIKA